MHPQSNESRSNDLNKYSLGTALESLEQRVPQSNEHEYESTTTATTTTSINANAFTADLFKPTASHIFLKRKRTLNPFIPESAERVKRMLPELQADQDFLHQMLDIWTAKLQQLQMDRQILERMASIPESQLQGVGPLVKQSYNYTQQQQQLDAPFTSRIGTSSNGRDPLLRRGQEQSYHRIHEPIIGTEEVDDNIDAHDKEQQERNDYDDLDGSGGGGDTGKNSGSDEEEDNQRYWDARAMLSEDEDEADEDEEAARRALTFMLAEFGDELE